MTEEKSKSADELADRMLSAGAFIGQCRRIIRVRLQKAEDEHGKDSPEVRDQEKELTKYNEEMEKVDRGDEEAIQRAFDVHQTFFKEHRQEIRDYEASVRLKRGETIDTRIGIIEENLEVTPEEAKRIIEVDELQFRIWDAQSTIGGCQRIIRARLFKAEDEHGKDSPEALALKKESRKYHEELEKIDLGDEKAIQRTSTEHLKFYQEHKEEELAYARTIKPRAKTAEDKNGGPG
ncbi:MAG: hypothetical protein P4M13_01385 [Alphaproteobacteria bacterium]|nr:hypothetical protein [Alphaproteobacteria bacterium]